MELYIHIPFCIKKCEYCDFLSAQADDETMRQYTEALLREMRFYGKQMNRPALTSVYIGGGTPTVLKQSYMELLLKQLHISFAVNRETEITMECNPGTVTKEKLESYYKSGVNRLSIGLQSTFDYELQLLGRIHTYGDFLHTYEMARQVGFRNINVDLMSALPYQTTEKYLTGLKRVAQLRPEHISAYSLIIEEGTPFYEKYAEDVRRRQQGQTTRFLPSEETEYEIGLETKRLLEEYGYERYEISNYARPGYACRHNVGYWRREPYLGIGLGAASLLGQSDIRYTNITDLKEYIRRCENIVPLEKEVNLSIRRKQTISYTKLHQVAEYVKRPAQMEEFMFLGLRMVEGVTRRAFRDSFGVEIEAVYPEVLKSLMQQDLLYMREGQIKLTERGMDLSNYVLAQFLLEEPALT
ncbi:MAG: radical SAM family heme chaperone HemW [Lachnospiraceae bacterium]|nr:radical SAM family heme chaperone HemW [Lachnospiraceae bacterium]